MADYRVIWQGMEQAKADHTKLMAKRGLEGHCHFILSEVQSWAAKIPDEDKGKIENAAQQTLDWLSGLDENNLVEEAEILAWQDWVVGIYRSILHRETEWRRAEPHPGASGGTLSAMDWLEAPTVATSPDERPLVQAAAASSREDTCLIFAGVSKWELIVQPEPPSMAETSVERAAFVAFTKEFLRSEFTDAELASMLELG
jgi:hypothetical protein